MPKRDAVGLLIKLRTVADDPFVTHPWATRLAGLEGFRARHGTGRAIYRIDRATQEVVVDRIDHRREVYR